MPAGAEDRYYQLVLIRMKDPATFSRYIDLVRPVVARYGGSLERMLVPESVYPESTPKPDIVNVVFYDSREAFTSFVQDPSFRSIVHLRSESIDMAEVGGPSGGGEGTGAQDHLLERVYLIEIARFGQLGPDGYRRYEDEAEPVMKRYGYHVERTLTLDGVAARDDSTTCVTSALALPFVPDLVKVAYFETREGMDRMHLDPDHGRIENDLYPAAVSQSMWIIGRVHPQSIPGAT